MDPSRIAELLDPFLGPEDQRPNTEGLIEDISTYIDILQRWNARVNLTAIRNEEEIVTRHFGESLFTARHLFSSCSPVPPVVRSFDGPPSAAVADDQPRTIDELLKVGDVGSGAGFPGIPIKLWSPEIHLTLIESNHKKATFLREITRALTLTDVNIQNTRAESLRGTSFDVVTLRAIERFESMLPTAATLLRSGGRLALLISQPQLLKAKPALSALTWSVPLPIPNSKSRVLAVGTRSSDCLPQPSMNQIGNKW